MHTEVYFTSSNVITTSTFWKQTHKPLSTENLIKSKGLVTDKNHLYFENSFQEIKSINNEVPQGMSVAISCC